MTFPKHKCGLSLEHNEHRNYYDNIADFITRERRLRFKDEESKRRAIETDEIWVLQWYPETPVGFRCVAAPTLEELLQWARENDT